MQSHSFSTSQDISGVSTVWMCLKIPVLINHQQSVRSTIFNRDFGGSKFWLTTWNPNSNAVEIFWKKIGRFPWKKGITTTQQTTKNLKFILNKNVYEQLMSERNHPILFSFFKKHVALPRWAKDCCWSPWRNITPSKLKYLSGSRVRTLGWKGVQKNLFFW